MATEYGKRLLQAMDFAKINQKELVKRTGLKQSTVSSAINRSKGSADTPAYAAACGVSALWLATGEGEMLPPTGEANGSLIFSGKATGEHKTNQPSALADNANAATNLIAAKSPSPYAVTIGLMFDTLPEDQNLRVAVMGQITNAILAAKRQQATELQTAPAPAQNPGKQSA